LVLNCEKRVNKNNKQTLDRLATAFPNWIDSPLFSFSFHEICLDVFNYSHDMDLSEDNKKALF
jgi:hypothetical protein